MKTLILYGSPRKNGDTISLINLIIPEIIGDYRIVNAMTVIYQHAWIVGFVGRIMVVQ